MGNQDRRRDEAAPARNSGMNRFGSIRFGSIFSKCLSGSFGNCFAFRFDAVRPAFFEHVMVRSGSVRFGSASGSSRFQNKAVRFGSVRFLIPSCIPGFTWFRACGPRASSQP